MKTFILAGALLLGAWHPALPTAKLHHKTTWEFEATYSDGRHTVDTNEKTTGVVTTFDNFAWACARGGVAETNFNQLSSGFYCTNNGHGWVVVNAFCDPDAVDSDEQKAVLGDATGRTVILKAKCETK